MAFKMWDLHAGFAVHGRPADGGHVVFLAILTPFDLVYRRIGDEPAPPPSANRRRLARGALEAAAGLALVIGVFSADLGRFGFAVDHVVKWLAFYPLFDGTVVLLAALAREVGAPARDHMRHPIVSRTPAEFWRRYNRPVGQYIADNIFKPCGGRRAPAVAVLVAFAVSGLLHEYIFAVALMRVDGYQLAFFGLHGVAVAATARVRPRGLATAPWTIATAAFNLATLVLFAASARAVLAGLVDIYPRGFPL
jgi:hypothetical protein